MVETFRCSHCAAVVTDDRWVNCPYCGAVLAKPTIDPLRAVVAPARFDAVERSDAYVDAKPPSTSGGAHVAGLGVRTVFLVVWTCMAGVMTVLFLPTGPLAIVPALMGIFGVGLVLFSVRETSRFLNASPQRFVAVVRDERVHVSGGGESPSTTQHFVLLERRDGARREFACDAATAGAVAPGDIGVAFVRADRLLEFRRVDA